MHILAGESALRALRAVRYYEHAVSLPDVSTHREQVLLPGLTVPETLDAQEDSWLSDLLAGQPTLEEMGFDFGGLESNCRVDLHSLGDLGRFTQECPLELVAFDASHRVRNKKSRTRSLPRTLPASAIVQVSRTLAFVCPELAVIQMASHLTVTQLARLIMELCGDYSLSANPQQRDGTRYQLPPVTTIERIRAHIGPSHMRSGAKTLRQALALALEGSASPGETTLSLMMSLPVEVGGYGFARPSLNAELLVPEDRRTFVAGSSYSLDAFWQQGCADLEYESSEFHLDPLSAGALVMARDRPKEADPSVVAWRKEFITKADADRRRLRDLQFLGIHVIPVTSFDLASVGRLDQVAYALARMLLPTDEDFTQWAADLDDLDYRARRDDLLTKLREDLI